MPGGGHWQVAPGQITDDGELTICLARGLAEGSTYDRDKVARWYFEWIRSPPFDIGFTTQSSLGAAASAKPGQSLAEVISQAAAARCMGSQANGSLMRATPLGVWGHRLPPAAVAKLAEADSSMSHPNPNCCRAVAAYSVAIAHLLTHPGDRDGALKQAHSCVAAAPATDVNDWLAAALRNEPEPYYPHIGYVKIAFIHAFRHLALGTSYEAAIHETLLGGGDTDTNACIVGGLIGASVGASAIPLAQRQAVLQCNTQLGRPRPAFLSAADVPELVNQLLKNAPG